jgi:hypothetical protein
MVRSRSQSESFRSRISSIPKQFARSYDRQILNKVAKKNRIVLVRETITSKDGPRSVEVYIPYAEPDSESLSLPLSPLELNQSNLSFLKSIGLEPSIILLSTLNIALEFSTGRVLSSSDLILSSEQSLLERLLGLGPSMVGFSVNEVTLERLIESEPSILRLNDNTVSMDRLLSSESHNIVLSSSDINVDFIISLNDISLPSSNLTLYEVALSILKYLELPNSNSSYFTENLNAQRILDNQVDLLKLSTDLTNLRREFTSNAELVNLSTDRIDAQKRLDSSVELLKLYVDGFNYARELPREVELLKLITGILDLRRNYNIEDHILKLSEIENNYQRNTVLNTIYLNLLSTNISTSSSGSQISYILDELSASAHLALSTRKLTSSYSGYCMNVQEMGSNAVADIGFDSNGNLDEEALRAHCLGNNGIVRIWYNQVTNINLSATSGVAPIIYSGTVSSVITTGSRASIHLSSIAASAKRLIGANLDPIYIPDNYTVFQAFDRDASSVYNNGLLGYYNGLFYAGGGPIWYSDNYIYFFPGFRGNDAPDSATEAHGTSDAGIGFHTLMGARSATAREVWLDATSKGSISGDYNNPSWNPLGYILNWEGSTGSQSKSCEVIAFYSTLSQSDCDLLHDSANTYWNT